MPRAWGPLKLAPSAILLAVLAPAAAQERASVPSFQAGAAVITVDAGALAGGTPVPAPAAPAILGAGKAPPTFAASAEAITVDVVVLDREGRPVTDLAAGDFTLAEDGRAQAIVGFEARALAGGGPEPAAPADDGAASNERAPFAPARTIAFLVDDLGIDPLHMREVTKAISGWLDGGADRRDAVTVVASSGDAWWSDTVGTGKADLQAVLARMKGRKPSAALIDAMSDVEAYDIDALGTPLEGAGEVVGSSGPPSGIGACVSRVPSVNALGRVVDRWFGSAACICDTSSDDTIASSIRACRGQAIARAQQVYGAARARAIGLLAAAERLSSGLAGARGRKSIVILSEGLLRDTDQRAFERTVDASRRGNTAISFVDVRGLMVTPQGSAEQRVPAKGGDLGALTMEATVLETAGGESMAETTGGSMIRNTNDVAGSVKKVADESAAYYLLGYQSDRPLDGKWRKLTVKVARPGLTVRARRGFFATAAPPVLAVENDKKKDKRKDGSLPPRAIDPALAVGGDRDQVPLRVAAHVLETDAAGTARVLVALEVGTAALRFAGTGAERTAQLDVTVLGVSRDAARTVPLDSHVALGIDARAVGGWYVFSRELRLPPGPAQVRAFVRDSATGRSGLVTQRIEVPPADKPYLSTPILSDRSLPALLPGGAPRVVVAAHRTFAPRGRLYCMFEVYVAPGRELQQMPHVLAGYRLEDAEGRPVAAEDPTPIAIALDARLTRTITLPLDGLAPGRYSLVVEAVDKGAGVSLHTRQEFAVEAPAQAAGAPPRPN